jgi:transcription initiation factor TFIIB
VDAEWRTFGNKEAPSNRSRVGGPENPLLNGHVQSTIIGPGRGDTPFDGIDVSKYQNHRTVSNSFLYYQSCTFVFVLVFLW